jgi:hypothetical protein
MVQYPLQYTKSVCSDPTVAAYCRILPHHVEVVCPFKPKLSYSNPNNRKLQPKVGVNPTLTKTIDSDPTDLVAYIITKSDAADIVFLPQCNQ